jgi:predicted nucleotidyltransferase
MTAQGSAVRAAAGRAEAAVERGAGAASERDLELIVARILARQQPEAIYVFGSHAKGTAAPGSDIDLLVVAPSRLPRAHRGKELLAALAAFPRRFDVLCYTPEELAEECADPGSFAATIMLGARRLYPRATV